WATAASPSTAKVIRGRGLSARKLGKANLALLAAEIKEGSVVLIDLSARQLASVVGCSPGYVTTALRTSPLRREAVRRGLRPLVEPRPKAGPEERLGKIGGEDGNDGVLPLVASE